MTTSELLDDAIRALSSALEHPGFDAAADQQLIGLAAEVEQAGRLIDAARVLVAAELDERSRYELGDAGLARRLGHARGTDLIEQVTRVSRAEAQRRVRLAAATRPTIAITGETIPPTFAVVARALTTGAIDTDAASTITRVLAQAPHPHAHPAQLEAAESALVDSARGEPADIVALQARVWREALDPDGAEPRDEVLRARRSFRLGREVGGMTPFSGAADPISAALLRAARAERSGPGVTPRFLPGDTAGSPPPDEATILGDPRSRDQRQFDIVMGLLTAGMRASEQGSTALRSTTTVVAVIRASDLDAGTSVGWLDDVAEPVSVASVRELVCEGGVRPVIVGEHGEVLHLGRRQRLFSAAQRRALAVRDGGCVWPRCTAPPSWCHAHHVTEWANGGTTDIDNGVLLCPAHHHLLHRSEFALSMRNGRPWLLAPPHLDPDPQWRPVGKQRVLWRRDEWVNSASVHERSDRDRALSGDVGDHDHEIHLPEVEARHKQVQPEQ